MFDCIPEYISYVVDECGDIVCRMDDSDADEILNSHPEYQVRCLPVC